MFTVHAEGRPPRVYVAVPEVIEDIFYRHLRDLVGLGPSMFEPLVTGRSVAFLNEEPHRLTRRLLAHTLDTQDYDGRARTTQDRRPPGPSIESPRATAPPVQLLGLPLDHVGQVVRMTVPAVGTTWTVTPQRREDTIGSWRFWPLNGLPRQGRREPSAGPWPGDDALD